MENFELGGKVLDLETAGCFKPNLTTKVLLTSAIKELSSIEVQNQELIEIGCGCGVISAFLLKFGYLNCFKFLGMSDLSEQAVHASELNVQRAKDEGFEIGFDVQLGSVLEPWEGRELDFVINDISAISDAIVPMNSWFADAPNQSGIDGLASTLKVLGEFNELSTPGAVMIFPVLSLSNTQLLFEELEKMPLQFTKLHSVSWPLPFEMVSLHREELYELKQDGHISFEEKFGQCIVQTECFKVKKV